MSIKWVEQKDATGFVSHRSECHRFFCAQWSILGVPYWDFWVLPSHRFGFFPSKSTGTTAIEAVDAEGVWPIHAIDARSNLAQIQAENARLTEAFKIRQAERAEMLAEQQAANEEAERVKEAEGARLLLLQKQLAEEAHLKAESERRAREEAEQQKKAEVAAKKAAGKKTGGKKEKKLSPVEEVQQPTLF